MSADQKKSTCIEIKKCTISSQIDELHIPIANNFSFAFTTKFQHFFVERRKLWSPDKAKSLSKKKQCVPCLCLLKKEGATSGSGHADSRSQTSMLMEIFIDDHNGRYDNHPQSYTCFRMYTYTWLKMYICTFSWITLLSDDAELLRPGESIL